MPPRRIARPSRQPRATRNETPQAPRQPEVSATQAARHENPQPRPDNTALNRQLVQQQQEGLGPTPGRPGGSPSAPGEAPQISPSLMQCLLLSGGGNVTAVDWDDQAKTLLVANGTVIDVLQPNGIYLERISTVDVGEAAVEINSHSRRLAVATATKVVYYHDYRDIATITVISKVAVDVLSYTVLRDTNPDWPAEVLTSYQTEPPGPNRGGQMNFPTNFLVVAESQEVTIYDVASGEPEMWMIGLAGGALGTVDRNMFGSSSQVISCLDWSDGILFIGSETGIRGNEGVNFARDAAINVRQAGTSEYNGTIAQRNDGLDFTLVDVGGKLVDNFVRDVSAVVPDVMTVENLLSDSEVFQTTWVASELTVSGTGYTKLVSSAVAGEHTISQAVTSANANHAFTVRLRKGEYRYVYVGMSDGTNLIDARFDLLLGRWDDLVAAVWTRGEAFMVQDGPDWICTVRGESNAGTAVTARVNVSADGNRSSAGDGASGLFIANAQLEQSLLPHDYIPSITGPTEGESSPAAQLVNVDVGGGIFITELTGLCYPVWAIAADGGYTIAIDDGNYFDITGQTGSPNTVNICTGVLYGNGNLDTQVDGYRIEYVDKTVADVSVRYLSTIDIASAGDEAVILNDAGADITILDEGLGRLYIGTAEGLTAISPNLALALADVRVIDTGDKRSTDDGGTRSVSG